MLVDKSNYSNHLHHVECLLPDRPVQYVPNSKILRLKAGIANFFMLNNDDDYYALYDTSSNIQLYQSIHMQTIQ